MKMFYTKNELKDMGKDELLKLTTFGGGDNAYYYADLEKLQANGSEYSFHFKDKTVIYTQQKETYDEVKLGKARYQLLTKTLEDNQEQDKREQVFFEEIRTMVASQVQNLSTATTNLENNADIAIKTIGEKTAGQMKAITKRLDAVAGKWDDKMDDLKVFDVDAFNVKMRKVDKIIDAFDKLLED